MVGEGLLTDDLGEGLEAELFGFGGAHEDDGRSAIIEWGGVGSSDSSSTIRLERGPESGDLVEHDFLVLFILGDDGLLALLVLDSDRDDLAVKDFCFVRLGGTLVRLDRMAILDLASDIVLLRRVLCAVAHVEIIIHVPETIVQQAVFGSDVSKDRVDARHVVRDVGHAFHPAHEHDIAMAELDALRGERDALHSGRTDFVDRRGFGVLWHAGADDYLAGGGLAEPCLHDMAKVDFFDLVGGDVGAADGTFCGDDTKVDSAKALQGSWRGKKSKSKTKEQI